MDAVLAWRAKQVAVTCVTASGAGEMVQWILMLLVEANTDGKYDFC